VATKKKEDWSLIIFFGTWSVDQIMTKSLIVIYYAFPYITNQRLFEILHSNKFRPTYNLPCKTVKTPNCIRSHTGNRAQNRTVQYMHVDALFSFVQRILSSVVNKVSFSMAEKKSISKWLETG
jgi:hypothetical protein